MSRGLRTRGFWALNIWLSNWTVCRSNFPGTLLLNRGDGGAEQYSRMGGQGVMWVWRCDDRGARELEKGRNIFAYTGFRLKQIGFLGYRF